MGLTDILIFAIVLLVIGGPVLWIVLKSYAPRNEQPPRRERPLVSLHLNIDKETDRFEPPGMGTFEARGSVLRSAKVVFAHRNPTTVSGHYRGMRVSVPPPGSDWAMQPDSLVHHLRGQSAKQAASAPKPSYINHVKREHWNEDILTREGDWTSD